MDSNARSGQRAPHCTILGIVTQIQIMKSPLGLDGSAHGTPNSAWNNLAAVKPAHLDLSHILDALMAVLCISQLVPTS